MTFMTKVKRGGSLFGAAAFAFAIVATAIPQQASAALLGGRSIQLSSTANGATNVVHKVGFTGVSTSNVASIVVEYCANSPIIGETCTAPTGFDTKFSTLTATTVSGNSGALTVSTALGANSANKVVLNLTTPAALTTATVIDLGNGTTNGMTNPTNTNVTFYARILTYSAADGGGTNLDAGGVAMSTNNELNVTAKVQETLTFCVFTGLACSDGGTAITLGDANGVLSNTATTYTKTAKYALASNALSGVVVRLKGDILKSGSFNIASHGAACTADSTATTAEQFGIRLSTVGASQTADANYGCALGSHAFDAANTTTLYGDTLATTAGASDSSVSEIEFAAKAAGTTEAGIYKSTMTLIATAKY